MAKGRWIEQLVDHIKNININLKKLQNYIKVLTTEFKEYYPQKNSIQFFNKDSKIATTKNENTKLAAENFTKVFNKDTEVDQRHVRNRRRKLIIHRLDKPINYKELNLAIKKTNFE